MSAALEDSMDELEAAARLAERNEIIALLESLKTEWRPGGSIDLDGAQRTQPKLDSMGRVVVPTSLPHAVEVWVLERAIAKIRGRK